MRSLIEYQQVLGITQKELAGRLGVGEDVLTRWLKGDREPTVRNLKAIADRTGISVAKLVDDVCALEKGDRRSRSKGARAPIGAGG